MQNWTHFLVLFLPQKFVAIFRPWNQEGELKTSTSLEKKSQEVVRTVWLLAPLASRG